MTTPNNPAPSSAAAVREAAALECEKRGHVTSADAIRAIPLPEPDEAKPDLTSVARAIQDEINAGFGISDLSWRQAKAAIDAFYTPATQPNEAGGEALDIRDAMTRAVEQAVADGADKNEVATHWAIFGYLEPLLPPLYAHPAAQPPGDEPVGLREDTAEIVRQFVDNWFAPWGAWKTAWWEGEVSENALKHVANIVSRATPSQPDEAAQPDDDAWMLAHEVEGAPTVKDGLTVERERIVAWQPIESAPRDATWVLLCGGTIDYGWDGETQPDMVVGQRVHPDHESWQFAWYDGGYYGEYENATHWMPRPGLPASGDHLAGEG